MGFEAAEGPEVEDPWHNFVALNIPKITRSRSVGELLSVNSQSGHDAWFARKAKRRGNAVAEKSN